MLSKQVSGQVRQFGNAAHYGIRSMGVFGGIRKNLVQPGLWPARAIIENRGDSGFFGSDYVGGAVAKVPAAFIGRQLKFFQRFKQHIWRGFAACHIAATDHSVKQVFPASTIDQRQFVLQEIPFAVGDKACANMDGTNALELSAYVRLPRVDFLNVFFVSRIKCLVRAGFGFLIAAKKHLKNVSPGNFSLSNNLGVKPVMILDVHQKLCIFYGFGIIGIQQSIPEVQFFKVRQDIIYSVIHRVVGVDKGGMPVHQDSIRSGVRKLQNTHVVFF